MTIATQYCPSMKLSNCMQRLGSRMVMTYYYRLVGDLQAVPAVKELTSGKMQPAAEDAAAALDKGAEQITEEIIAPVAKVWLAYLRLS